MIDRGYPSKGLSKEDYNMLADLRKMSWEHSEITTADTATIYNKEEPKYGRKVRFNRREIQEISC